MHAPYVKGTKKMKRILSRPNSFNMDQNSQKNVLINNSRIAWPAEILMQFQFIGQFSAKCLYFSFSKSVDTFEIEYTEHANFDQGTR